MVIEFLFICSFIHHRVLVVKAIGIRQHSFCEERSPLFMGFNIGAASAALPERVAWPVGCG